MKGKLVEFNGNGSPFSGYFVAHENGGPGVILIQEWWGLVGHIKSVADRLAEAGFSVLAPDFYHGKSTDEPDEAGSLMMALDIDNAEKVIHGAIEFLLTQDVTTSEKAGVVGFCMGGQLSLYAATCNENIGACVNYYGIHPNVKPNLENLKAPLMGFFAELDDYASPESVSALDAELTKLGKEHEFKTYAGRQHAFFNNDRPEVYDREATEDSWKLMTEFFRRELS